MLTLRLNPKQDHSGKTVQCADRGDRYCLKDKEHTWSPGFTSLSLLSHKLFLCFMSI